MRIKIADAGGARLPNVSVLYIKLSGASQFHLNRSLIHFAL
jgi:hypothetical protein